MITVYGLKTCDTTRQALRWLEARGVACAFHDVRDAPVGEEVLARWLDEVGWEALVNRRSTTWRALADRQRAAPLDDAWALSLLGANPTLIKRPVIDLGKRRLVGFGAAQQAELATALG